MDFDQNISIIQAANKNLYGLVDPSFQQAYKLIYQNEVPFHLRYIDFDQNVKELGDRQNLKVRIFIQGVQASIHSIKIELTSENDIFFNLGFNCDAQRFNIIRQKQQLCTDLQGFPTILIKSLNKLQKQNGNFSGTITMYSDTKANLSINQSSQYKNIQIMNLDFVSVSEEFAQQTVVFRYQNLKKQIQLTQKRLRQINNIIKQKNPSLLLQIQKTTKK